MKMPNCFHMTWKKAKRNNFIFICLLSVLKKKEFETMKSNTNCKNANINRMSVLKANGNTNEYGIL